MNRPPQLRDDAEAELARSPTAEAAARSAEALLHELQVHQIELAMQNESLRQTQMALEESRDRYLDLFEFAPVGYLTLTDKGLIADINLSGATLLGVERAKVLQRRFAHFVTPEDTDRWHLHFINVLKQDEKLDCELALQRTDGIRFHVRVDSLRMVKDGQAPTVRIVLTDITEIKRLDQALQEKNVELENAKSVAEKANLAKSDFLSSMSHELRTPLNAILGFTQLIESSSPPPPPIQKRNLDQILKAGWYLLELINEILDLAQIESGRSLLSQEPVSLGDVMLECRAMIEPQAEKRGIGMTFPRFDIPCFVNADRTRVKQVLINLLFNAIKYNKLGGAVAVECTPSAADAMRIGVRDTGVGLTAGQLAQLFQPFNRIGKEASAEEGTGIGLVVTKRLVELMGGTIGVDSAVGVGSVFWIELSLASAPQLAVMEAAHIEQVRPQVSADTLQRTLLYVEDNPANLELVEQLIARRPDLSLISAADGDLGIEFARAYQPAVILMDINLPGISGIDTMRILRADPATAHIPIIALSANALPRDIEKAIAAGFFDYLTKPIKVNEFMATLDVALNFAQTTAALAAPKESPG